MVTTKLSRVNDMNYNYYIDRDRIFEVENNGRKIPADLFGDSIRFLVENKKELALHPHSQRKKRKLEWIKENHPEWFI